MTDLPINPSSVPANAAAVKQPGNAETAQQEEQGFGNVLSQKLADSAKPASPAAPGDKPRQPAGQDQVETNQIEDTGSALPADMLAVLLGQQNQAATTQPDTVTQTDVGAQPDFYGQAGFNSQAGVIIQPGLNAQPAPSAQTSATATKGKNASAALALISADGNPAISGKPALDSALPQLNNPSQPGHGFVDTFKALGVKETSSGAGTQPLRSGVAGELPVAAAQNLALPLLPAAAAPASPTGISAALNQPAWGDEFSQQITWMATQRNQTAELHLNPPQLGPLDVVLKMNGDQATAVFTSPHAAVREAIEQALPKLREMLADSGIMLGNAMVSDQTAKNNPHDSPQKSRERTPTPAADDAKEGGSIQELRVSGRSRHHGMVDTFA